MKKDTFLSVAVARLFLSGVHFSMTPPSCRFVPTCSEYAIEAIKKHGPF